MPKSKKALDPNLVSGRKAGKLADQHELFCQEYLKDFNATRAYMRAYGVAAKTAGACGSRLLERDEIQRRIAEVKEKRRQRVEIDQDRVLREIAAVAFSNITDVVTVESGRVRVADTKGLKLSTQKAISEITETTTEAGGSLRVKMHDKIAALEKLARHVGLYDNGSGSDSEGASAQLGSVLIRLQKL